MTAFLTLDGVAKGFGSTASRTEVLHDVNLSVEKGEFVAIVGYSGSGKTTLVSLVAGLLYPDEGTISVDGRPVTGPGPERGVVFQNYSLLPWLSVFENVMLAVDGRFPDWSNDQKTKHVERFIAMVNLSPARDKRPPNSPAACGNEWRLHGHWRWTPKSCCSTSRWARSTP